MSSMRLLKDYDLTRGEKVTKHQVGEVISVPFQTGREMIAGGLAVYANVRIPPPENLAPEFAQQIEDLKAENARLKAAPPAGPVAAGGPDKKLKEEREQHEKESRELKEKLAAAEAEGKKLREQLAAAAKK